MTTNPHPKNARRRLIRLSVTTPGGLPHPVDVDELAELIAGVIARRWGVEAAVGIVYDSAQDPAAG